MTNTPTPPYYAVIFIYEESDNSTGYAKMSARVNEIVKSQPGFLGVDDAKSELGISVSYWKDLESIKGWKNNLEHREAKARGKELWYTRYKVRIARVEQEY